MKSIFKLNNKGHITPPDIFALLIMLAFAPLFNIWDRWFKKKKNGCCNGDDHKHETKE